MGVIPESQSVLQASNSGVPVIHDDSSISGMAYQDLVARLLGEDVPLRFLDPEKKSLLKRLFGT